MDWIGATTRAALPVAVAVAFCAAPQDARAGICKDNKASPGCVKTEDFAKESIDSVDLKNESEAYFNLGDDVFKISGGIRPYAQVTFTPPSDGTLVILASVDIVAGLTTSNSQAKDTVRCDFRTGKNPKKFSSSRSINGSSFRGTMNRRFQTTATASNMITHPIKGGGKKNKKKKKKPLTIFLACFPDIGDDLSIFRPSITVVFHPITYN